MGAAELLAAAAVGGTVTLLGKIVFDWLKGGRDRDDHCRYREPPLDSVRAHISRKHEELVAEVKALESKNGALDKAVTVLAVQIGANQKEMVALLRDIRDDFRARRTG